MNPIQAAADPSTYLTPNEHLILPPRRHHVIMGLLPAFQAALFAILSTLALASFGVFAVPLIVFFLVVVARSNGHARGFPFGLLVLGVLLVVGWLTSFNEDAFAGYVAAATLVYAIVGYIQYVVTWVFLTDKRIFRVNGIFTRRVATLPLRALTDIRYDRSLIGKYLGYGHFFVESAGQHQALSALRFIDKPNEFYGVVMEEALGQAKPPKPEADRPASG